MAGLMISSAGGQPESDLNGFYRWDHFTVSQGLPSPNIHCITQDSTGYLWLGTDDGLVRYDGYEMVVFSHDPADSTTLSNNDITAIAVDHTGYLWIGTANGLNRMDPTTGKTSRLFTQENQKNKLPGHHIRAMLIDSRRRFWIETVDGSLNLFHAAKGTVITYSHQAPSQIYYKYHQIYEAPDGRLWIAGRGIPPVRFDPGSGEFTTYPTSRTDPRYKRENDGACYMTDSNGQLLMGALDGLYVFDQRNGTVRKIHAASTFALVSDGHGQVWAATGSGVFRHYTGKRPPDRLSHDENNPASLINNHVNVVFVDASGCLWAGTREGLSRWAPARHKFKLFTHRAGNENTLGSSRVSALVPGPDNALWIGTDGSGLDRLDLATETFRHYKPENTPGMKGGRIKALYFDRFHQLWVGLWHGTGFGHLDIVTGRFSLYSFDPSTQMYDWYNDFAEDELNNFYVGFWGAGGVTRFNRTTRKFGESFFHNRSDPVVSRLTTDLYCDRLGKIWIGSSDNGFSTYNPWSDRMTSYPATPQGFPEEGVNAFFEDSQGRMWIAAKGFYRFYQSAAQFVDIGAWCQLPARSYFAITEDKNKMLWLSTDRGLIRFNPENYSFTVFTANDGLQGDLFSKAACRLADGRLAVGGNGGLNLFDPDEVVVDDFAPAITITSLTINGQLVKGENPIDRLSALRHDENFITIRFAAFDFNNPDNIRYNYQLKGFDDRTVITGHGSHEAVFTNVPPGEYRLIIHSTNAGGVWVDNHLAVTVRIGEPWWNSWWFSSLLVIMIGGGLYWLVRNRSEKARIKEESLELQQKLLRSRMNPHFIFNSLFAIQNFIYANSTDIAGRYLSDFALLMRRILDQSAEDFIPLAQEIKTLELYLKLQLMRFPDRYTASVEVDPKLDINEAFVPPMLVQPLVENAIEHGIKNRIGGLIRVFITIHGGAMVITVADNGVGIQNRDEGAFQAGSKRTHALQITRDRIALLNAKFHTQLSFVIKATNPLDTHFPGTTIELTIPPHPKTFKPCSE